MITAMRRLLISVPWNRMKKCFGTPRSAADRRGRTLWKAARNVGESDARAKDLADEVYRRRGIAERV